MIHGTIWLLTSVVLVVSLPSTLREPTAGSSLKYVLPSKNTYGAPVTPGLDSIGNACMDSRKLFYTETIIVVKDATSLINGTLEINVGDQMTALCVQIEPKTEHDRLALKEVNILGPNSVQLRIQEPQYSKAKALEYLMLVYGSFSKNYSAKYPLNR